VTKTTCEQVILDVGGPTEISGVLPCETKTKDRCLVIDIPYTRLTITFSGDAESPQPRAVESISVEQYVVVS
jgi:hypothetical protein